MFRHCPRYDFYALQQTDFDKYFKHGWSWLPSGGQSAIGHEFSIMPSYGVLKTHNALLAGHYIKCVRLL